MMPIVDGLEEEFEGRVTVSRLDAAVPENARLQTQYGLRGHPSFVLLDGDGRVVLSFLGPQEKFVLRVAMAGVANG
jgi:thioredoxin-like negative regulator of GroEL